MNSTIKAGWKTTEFWVTLAVTASGLGVALGVLNPEQSSVVVEQSGVVVDSVAVIANEVTRIIAAITSAVAAFGYAIGRGLAKQG